jgi:hypothetical protein
MVRSRQSQRYKAEQQRSLAAAEAIVALEHYDLMAGTPLEPTH